MTIEHTLKSASTAERVYWGSIILFGIALPITHYLMWQHVKEKLLSYTEQRYMEPIEPPSYFSNLVREWTVQFEISFGEWLASQIAVMIAIVVVVSLLALIIGVIIAIGRVELPKEERVAYIEQPALWLVWSLMAMLFLYIVVSFINLYYW